MPFTGVDEDVTIRQLLKLHVLVVRSFFWVNPRLCNLTSTVVQASRRLADVASGIQDFPQATCRGKETEQHRHCITQPKRTFVWPKRFRRHFGVAPASSARGLGHRETPTGHTDAGCQDRQTVSPHCVLDQAVSPQEGQAILIVADRVSQRFMAILGRRTVATYSSLRPHGVTNDVSQGGKIVNASHCKVRLTQVIFDRCAMRFAAL